jgi:hypothetical protein
VNLSNITKRKTLTSDPPVINSETATTASPATASPVIVNQNYISNVSLLSSHSALIAAISLVKSTAAVASQGSSSITPEQLGVLLSNNGTLWAQSASEYESGAWEAGTNVPAMMYSALQSLEQDAIQSYSYLNSLGADPANWAITPDVRRIFNRRVDLAGSVLARLSDVGNSVWNSTGQCLMEKLAGLIDGMARGVNVQEVNQLVTDLRRKPSVSQSEAAMGAMSGSMTAVAAMGGPMTAEAIATAMTSACVAIKSSEPSRRNEWKAVGNEIRRLTLATLTQDSMAVLGNLAAMLYEKLNRPMLQIGTTVISSNLLGDCTPFDNLISEISRSVEGLESNLIYRMYSWENSIERKYSLINSLADMSISRAGNVNQTNLLSRLAMILPSIELTKGASSILSAISSRI